VALPGVLVFWVKWGIDTNLYETSGSGWISGIRAKTKLSQNGDSSLRKLKLGFWEGSDLKIATAGIWQKKQAQKEESRFMGGPGFPGIISSPKTFENGATRRRNYQIFSFRAINFGLSGRRLRALTW